MGPPGPNPRAEALGPNPTGRGVEAVPALARGHMGLGPQGPNQAWEDVAVDYQDSSFRRDDTVHREPTIIQANPGRSLFDVK